MILMRDRQVVLEKCADKVLGDEQGEGLPVDPRSIAKREEIVLEENNFPDNFYGRIEYLPNEGKWILYHQAPRNGTVHSVNVVRFSIAHELGHYFIREHRQDIEKGKVHNSLPFLATIERNREREAEFFASALLMPEKRIKKFTHPNGELKDILEIANQCHVSPIPAAIRYVHLSSEVCGVLVSKGGKVCYYVGSEDADALGLKYIEGLANGAVASNVQQGEGVKSCYLDIENWFPHWRKGGNAVEQAYALGHTGFVLSMIYFEDIPYED